MCFPSVGQRNNAYTGNVTQNKDNKPVQSQKPESKPSEVKQETPSTKDTAEIKTQTSKSATPAPVSLSFDNKLASKNAEKKEIAPTGATEYSKEETKKIIKEAEKYGKELFPKNDAAASDSAWGWALQKRNSNPKDVNWAAAEHYLYAKSRSKESKVEGVAIGVLAAGYDVVKAGLFAVGKEEWLATDGKKENISKPTLGSTISGIEGAIDGFKHDEQ